MKKKPRIYLEKTPENNEKPQTYKMFKKSQNQTSKARCRYLHIKIKVIRIIYILFLTSSSLFLNILTITIYKYWSRLAANQMYEVWYACTRPHTYCSHSPGSIQTLNHLHSTPLSYQDVIKWHRWWENKYNKHRYTPDWTTQQESIRYRAWNKVVRRDTRDKLRPVRFRRDCFPLKTH